MQKILRRTFLLVTVFAVLGVGGMLGYRAYREHTAQPPFPVVDTTALSPARAAVIGVLAAWRPSYRAAKMDVLEAVSEA